MTNKIFSIPLSKKRQASMRRRFVIFSSVLFTLVFVLGSAIFIVLMNQIMHKSAGKEVSHVVEMERFKLEVSINSEIAIALKMADSPIIQRYFLNPEDSELQKFALEEIAGYRRAFTGNNIFWISDKDKKYYFNNEYVYTLNPLDKSSWWYDSIMTMHKPYDLHVDFNIGIKKTMLWINIPVFDSNHKSIGIVGTGINLADFINAMYQNHSEAEELYFFNGAGEITGANDITLVENRVNITKVLDKTGKRILARTKRLKNKEIKYFEAKENEQIIAVGSIKDLDWYITVIRHFSIGDSLQTGMTVLFGVMMVVILVIFVIFNIFIIGMLEPLNRMVKTITQTFADWDMHPQKSGHHRDEVGTLGDFFHLTIIDQLTGIYNRRYLDGNLKKIIKSHSRTCLSVLLIDIDYFKRYNDTYGHDEGDSCLKAVAAIISQCTIRAEDFVVRYGGEEFAAVLPNTDRNGAQVVAEQMLEKVRAYKIPHKASDISAYVTISIGGTTDIVKHSQSPQDYIKAADKALYESKRNGRDRYTYLQI